PRRAWLELIRAPNLLTLPGNVLVGVALAGMGGGALRWIPAVLSGLALYAFGLIGNDLADREEDARDRPRRPLPSGRISLRSARFAALLCALTGLAAAGMAGWIPGAIAITIAVLSVAYNAGGKKSPLFSILSLGLCRGLLVLLGAAAADPGSLRNPQVLGGAGLITLYIAAVSLAARGEMKLHRTAPGVRVLPLLAAGLGIGLLAATGDGLSVRHILPALLILSEPIRFLAITGGMRGVDPARIGRLLGHLCLIQAALLVWLPTRPIFWGLAGMLVAMTALHAGLSRRFAAS
ncbi:MAG: UbiA family prenyltransferase, partial [Kiritimatiellia bacterium]|nr:UbiA family prenyltransferase [Kiritimatiellia bacterium]